ncbi:hypothetical protein [Anaerovorax sp. IOR16]|nr:hypothetical protein [Anaerovorax sp. IOR16]
MKDENKNICDLDYKKEYCRQQEQLCKALQENEQLKKALLNLALLAGEK